MNIVRKPVPLYGAVHRLLSLIGMQENRGSELGTEILTAPLRIEAMRSSIFYFPYWSSTSAGSHRSRSVRSKSVSKLTS